MRFRTAVKTIPPCAALLGAIVLCCAGPTQAQNPTIRYAANFEEVGSSQPAAIVADAAGNAFVTGQACLDAACRNQEAVTIKYDPSGNLLWKAWLTSPVGVAQSVDIGIDAASNTYVLFLLWQKRNSSNQLTDPDIVTAKYNAEGVRQWINFLSSTSAVTRTPVKLSVSPSGDVYVTTEAASVPANTKASVLTFKYSTTGQMQWAQVAPPASNPLSVPIGIQQDAKENVYVLVKSSCPSSGSVSSRILKYASNGTLLKSFGSEQLGDPVAFQVSAAGNSYAVGFAPTARPGAAGNVTLAKFNPDGTLEWSNNLGSTVGSPAAPQPVALALDPKEDVFLGSTTEGSGGAATRMVATKFDTDGCHLWSSTYDEAVATDADSVTTIVTNSFGDLYVMGTRKLATDPLGAAQISVVKFGISGRQLFSTSYAQDSNGDLPIGMTVGGQGGLFITGTADTALTGNDWLVLDYVQDGGTISPSSYDFGTVIVSARSLQVIFTLVNTGEVELTNINLTLTGTDQGFVMLWNTCSAIEAPNVTPLVPGGNCQFALAMYSNGPGEALGTVTLTDNWTGSKINPQTIQLSGFVPFPPGTGIND